MIYVLGALIAAALAVAATDGFLDRRNVHSCVGE